MRIVQVGGSSCVGSDNPPIIELQDCDGDNITITAESVNGGADASIVDIGNGQYQVIGAVAGPYIIKAECCT